MTSWLFFGKFHNFLSATALYPPDKQQIYAAVDLDVLCSIWHLPFASPGAVQWHAFTILQRFEQNALQSDASTGAC